MLKWINAVELKINLILQSISGIITNMILIIMSMITRIIYPNLHQPTYTELFNSLSGSKIINDSVAAKPISENFTHYEGNYGVVITTPKQYFYSDLDVFREMVSSRSIRKFVPSILLWLFGLEKSTQTLFVQDNIYRDKYKYKYLNAMKRPYIKEYISRCHDYFSNHVQSYSKMNFEKDGMVDELQRLSVQFLSLTHFNHLLDPKLVDDLRIQSNPSPIKLTFLKMVQLLFKSGPNARKLYNSEINDTNRANICILSKWLEGGINDPNILKGELAHNVSLTSGPISHLLGNIVYYLWKYSKIKQQLLDESSTVDISNIDNIDQLAYLDQFILETTRNATIDFGLAVTKENTRPLPKGCPFIFKFYTSTYKAKYWGDTYSQFDPSRFSDHIKNNQDPRTDIYIDGKDTCIQRTINGEYVPKDVFIPSSIKHPGYASFGVGERRCPGEVLVNYIAKIFTIIMIRNFDWEPQNIERIENKTYNAISSPIIGDELRMKFTSKINKSMYHNH
jgi:hypothetical protein